MLYQDNDTESEVVHDGKDDAKVLLIERWTISFCNFVFHLNLACIAHSFHSLFQTHSNRGYVSILLLIMAQICVLCCIAGQSCRFGLVWCEWMDNDKVFLQFR